MNLKEQLLVEMSRKNMDFVASYIGNDKERFKELVDIIFTDKDPLSWRAVWASTVITDKYPELMYPYVGQIIDTIDTFKNTGVHRMLLRYLSYIEIEEEYQGKIYDLCYNWLLSATEPIAVKANCMQILYNIAKTEPDLQNELRLICEELLTDKSAGIRNKSKNLLALL